MEVKSLTPIPSEDEPLARTFGSRSRITLTGSLTSGKKIIQKNKHHINHSSTHDDMSDSEGELGIFEEPEDFYEAEKEPTFVDYTLQSGLKLNLRLVGHNPLWVSLLTSISPHEREVMYI